METARQLFTHSSIEDPSSTALYLLQADRQQRLRFLRTANGIWGVFGLVALTGALAYPIFRSSFLVISGLLLAGSFTALIIAWKQNLLAARLLLVILPDALILYFFLNNAIWTPLDLPLQTAVRGALLAAVSLPVFFSIQFFRHWGVPASLIFVNMAAIAWFARWNGWAAPLALLVPVFWGLLAAAAWQYERALRRTGDSAMAVIAPARQTEEAYEQTIESWSRALSLRDSESEEHTRKVTELAVRFGEHLGLDPAQIAHLRRGALLHDIGKMAIPDSVLHKPGRLTAEEWDLVREHPATGYRMLLHISYLQPCLDVIFCHHERWDGSGYPRGLKGEEIPLMARIFSLADVWDAMGSDQPYRAAWSEEAVRTYIHQQAGRQFDPNLACKFLEMMKPQD